MANYFDRSVTRLTPTPNRRFDDLSNAIFSNLRVGRVQSSNGFGKVSVILEGANPNTLVDNPNGNNEANYIQCQMLSPYFSQKPAEAAGSDPTTFEDSQTASGACFPAPQPGTYGLVAMAENDPNLGFWLGAFPEPGIGRTIPEPPTAERVGMNDSDASDLASGVGLPSGEMVKRSQDGSIPQEKYKNPVHPFAHTLRTQGLLVDTIRGQTTSSAMRDPSNRVLGMNTPGASGTATQLDASGTATKVTRMGGHSFTMDDGDVRGNNNLLRLRSSKGGQFLIHDTAELVYIANQSGTAWIEMTADGKIDIYSKDSVSIHSENDFNFRAKRDVNLEAGRNVNVKSVERFTMEGEVMNQLATGSLSIDSRGPLDITGIDTRLFVANFSMQSEQIDITNKLDLSIKSSNMDLQTFFGITASAGTGIELKTANAANQVWLNNYNPGRVYEKGQSVIFANQFYKALSKTETPAPAKAPVPPASGPFWVLIPPAIPKVAHPDLMLDTNPLGRIQLSSFKDVNVTSVTGKIDIKATQNVHMDGAQIRMNEGLSGTSDLAAIATASTLLEPRPTTTTGIAPLSLWSNPKNDPEADWASTAYLTTETINSIMRRIPQHEPWTGHEGLDKDATSPQMTDRDTE